MSFTPEQEAALLALLDVTNKTISDLEAAPDLTEDMLTPVENGAGTFATSLGDVKDFVLGAGTMAKNKIINGNFHIWQRGTSFAAATDNSYSADRWFYGKAPTAVHTLSRSTDVPSVAQSGKLHNYSLLADCTTLQSSMGSTDRVLIGQKIEGYNWLPLAQKQITLSFWVKATKIGIYCVSLQNSASDRTITKEFTINTTDTWEKKTLTFAASPSAGTWDYLNGVGLQLFFILAAGSSFQGTADAWQSSNILCTSNQVNGVDSASNNFRLCDVQLEAGEEATAFEERTIQEEILLCERYFEKSYDLDIAPATTGTDVVDNGAVGVVRPSGTSYDVNINFRTHKRAAPTVVSYSPATGATGKVRDSTGVADISASPYAAGKNGFYNSATVTAGHFIYFHFTADCEL